jgi:quercetin dioxygenase-like cupin family protein
VPRDSSLPFTIDWSNYDLKEVRPGVFGATEETPQLTVTLYRYGAGSSWEEHQHPEDQITTVLEGEINFTIAGEPAHMTKGDVACLPGGVPHSATVGPEPVTTLNIYTLRGSRG